MRKVWTAFLVCLTVSALCGCGQKKETAAPASAAADTEAPAAKPEVKMGFIYIGPVGDGGWTFEHDKGRLYAEKETGIKTIYKENVPEGPEVKEIMRNMIDQGCNVIVATSFGYMDYMEEIAKEYPDVKFLHCSGYKQAENMANYFGRMYEPRYLSGIVAAMKTETGKIGYVAAFEIPEVIRGINAFTLGVRSIKPEAEVIVRWTHTWYDPAKEKAAAIALLDEGCDVIAQHQDTAGPQQAAEERGKWAIGYDSDMSKMAPKSNMTSPIWNWGPYYAEQVRAIQNGTWKTHAYWGNMKDNVVLLAPLTALAPEGAQAKIDEAAKKINDGSLIVFAGPLLDQEGKEQVAAGSAMTDKEMLSMDWFVQGVIGNSK
ncbi:MAG: BMP family ABC transporter substrate-binding protein [Kiritimatiellae bacterium]|nr:BMP family ABC transporter substrate-binding protein [Kiritimatiellia bacterium]MDD4736178.1 BMP family ABC transporter substrate-binding protein [Kiritimatiellia bacterium]